MMNDKKLKDLMVNVNLKKFQKGSPIMSAMPMMKGNMNMNQKKFLGKTGNNMIARFSDHDKDMVVSGIDCFGFNRKRHDDGQLQESELESRLEENIEDKAEKMIGYRKFPNSPVEEKPEKKVSTEDLVEQRRKDLEKMQAEEEKERKFKTYEEQVERREEYKRKGFFGKLLSKDPDKQEKEIRRKKLEAERLGIKVSELKGTGIYDSDYSTSEKLKILKNRINEARTEKERFKRINEYKELKAKGEVRKVQAEIAKRKFQSNKGYSMQQRSMGSQNLDFGSLLNGTQPARIFNTVEDVGASEGQGVGVTTFFAKRQSGNLGVNTFMDFSKQGKKSKRKGFL